MKKVLFIHYRTGERDGVSLEIEKRVKALRKLGMEVGYVTGYDGLKRKEAFMVPQMDLKTNLNKFLLETFFDTKIIDEHQAIPLYHNVEHEIYMGIDKAFQKFQPDLVIVHNMLSLSYNLPATTALTKVLDKWQIPTIPVHHDFWFEREKFMKPNYSFIREIQESLPPNRPYFLKHITINSLALSELERRRKIQAYQIGDYFNFSDPQPIVDSYNKDLLESFGIDKNDLFVLQATRITNRKAIENAMYFVYHMEKTLHKQKSTKIGDKVFTDKNRVVLFFPNFIEVDAIGYFRELRFLADELKIKVIWGLEKFAPERRQPKGVKTYSFWDAYVYADLVTYPSLLEGFGNQFLEACFYKKLTVAFEYPVFKKDIIKEGYEYVSLGDVAKKKNGFYLVPQPKIIEAVNETISILQDRKRLEEITEKNFKIAQQNHDESRLVKDLLEGTDLSFT